MGGDGKGRGGEGRVGERRQKCLGKETSRGEFWTEEPVRVELSGPGEHSPTRVEGASQSERDDRGAQTQAVLQRGHLKKLSYINLRFRFINN